MYPHPNKLPRWLYRLLLITGALLLLTGLAWEAVHYSIGAAGNPMGLPHPLENALMRVHGAVMLAFMLGLGGLGTVHVPRGWRENRNRSSGLILIALAGGLALSAYLLYYWAGDTTHPIIGLIHFGMGLAMAVLVLWHRRQKTLPR